MYLPSEISGKINAEYVSVQCFKQLHSYLCGALCKSIKLILLVNGASEAEE